MGIYINVGWGRDEEGGEGRGCEFNIRKALPFFFFFFFWSLPTGVRRELDTLAAVYAIQNAKIRFVPPSSRG